MVEESKKVVLETPARNPIPIWERPEMVYIPSVDTKSMIAELDAKFNAFNQSFNDIGR